MFPPQKLEKSRDPFLRAKNKNDTPPSRRIQRGIAAVMAGDIEERGLLFANQAGLSCCLIRWGRVRDGICAA